MKKICIAVFVASILLLAIGGAIIVLAMKEEDSKKARAGTIVAGTGMAGLTILGVIILLPAKLCAGLTDRKKTKK